MKVTAVTVTKQFNGNTALDHVDLYVNSGEFFTMLGPSGCGKTTLLRIIAGLESADYGEVWIGEKEYSNTPAKERPVNTVFQNYLLFPHMTVFENVAFGLKARKVSPGEIPGRVMKTLDLVQMTSFKDRLPSQMSGGQQQRVALARALVNEPDVLLLDEPMSALDAKLRAQMQIELRRLQRRIGKTFIMVTHDQEEALTVSDRLVVMNKARIEQGGTPREVYERPHNRFVAEFLGVANLIQARREGDSVSTEFGPLKLSETPEWTEGTLAIRPESMRFLPLGAQLPVNAFKVKVQDVIYRGQYQEVWLEGNSLRARILPNQPINPGDEAYLELPPESLVPLKD